MIDLIPITFKQAGSVYLFDLTTVIEKGFDFTNDMQPNPAMLASFSGDRSYGRFGASVSFKDTDHDAVDDLIIGSPYRTEDLTEEITGGMYQHKF